MTTPSLLHSLSTATRLLGIACSAAIGASLVVGSGCTVCDEPTYLLEITADPDSRSVRGAAIAVAGDVEPIAVGPAGAIVQRAEGGWIARDSGLTADLRAVALDPTHAVGLALAAGDRGAVVRSVDAGARWSTVDLGTTTDLRAVAIGRADGADEAWALAAGGAEIFRSTDGGATWAATPHGAGELDALAAAIDVTGTQALVVGRGGVALVSEDAGRTWTALPLPTRADLTVAVAGVDGGWYVGSDDGEVLRIAAALDVAVLESGVDAPVRGLADADDALWIVRDDRIDLRFPGGELHSAALDRPATAAALDPLRGLVVAGDVPSGWFTRGEYVAGGSHLCGEAIAGRPLIVDGRARTAALCERGDWSAALEPDVALPDELRACLADAWASDGRFEHASIASFARFVLQLLAVGAPPELVREAQAAISDEVYHAALCFALASAYAGRPLGPGPLVVPTSDHVPADLSQAAAACAREACVHETIAAVQARTAAGLARDPVVRRALEQIAEDESRHAALGWRFVAWALRTGGEPVRAAVARAFAEELPAGQAGEAFAGCEGHGRLGPLARAGVARRAVRDIIAPLAHKLIHASGEPSAARLEEIPCPDPPRPSANS